jgi:predicted nucleic acid-binding protein
MILVVDASLAAKWVLREPDTANAIALLRNKSFEFAAPELIFLEVAGALVRRANTDKSVREEMLEALREWAHAWSEQLIRAFPLTEPRLLDASSLAVELGTPLKDCVYLALAREMQCDLATCDVKFREKAVRLYPRVRLLDEYVPSA